MVDIGPVVWEKMSFKAKMKQRQTMKTDDDFLTDDGQRVIRIEHLEPLTPVIENIYPIIVSITY